MSSSVANGGSHGDSAGGLESVPEKSALGSQRVCDHKDDPESRCLSPPLPLITKRNRRLSLSERAMQGPMQRGLVKYFCRQSGHGFITPTLGGDDIFVHITDIDGEYVPHEGDEVIYKECPCPPKFDRMQAIHVTIKNLAPGRHERWTEPPSPHKHPHPPPNTAAIRDPDPHLTNAMGSPKAAHQ